MLQYSPKIITDSLVMCLDASQNKSYPTDLPVKNGLLVWLDAADDSTFSYSSGTEVSQWRDKSGNNLHANQATTVNQPSRSSVINSRKGVNFTPASGDFIRIPNGVVFSKYFTAVVVVKPGTQSADYAVILDQDHSTTGYQGWVIQRGAASSFWQTWVANSSANNWTNANQIAYVDNTSQIVTLRKTSSTLALYSNGTSSGDVSINDYNLPQAGLYGLNIGYWSAGGGRYYNGDICEILIYNRDLTTTELKQVHTYLGQKWGISNTDRSVIDLAGNDDNGLLGNGSTSNMPLYDYYNKGSFKFFASNKYIKLGISTVVNQFAGDFTVSLWAMATAENSNYGNLIGDYYTAGTLTTAEWQIMMNNSSAFLNVYRVGTGYIINNTSSGFSANTWINVVLTRVGSTVTLYANNNVIGTATNSLVFGSATGNVNIGIDSNNSAEPFSGLISNVLIYRKGLSAVEVAQNYEAQKSKFANTIVQQGLMLHLDADNPSSYAGAGTVWYDVSGNAYNAGMNNITPSNWVTYNGVKAFETNDTNNQNFTVGSFPFPQSGRTYEIWINSKSFSIGWQTWFDDGGGERVLFGTSTNTMHVYPSVEVSANLVVGQWYQLLYTMVGGNGTAVVVYKDGQAIGSGTYGYVINSGTGILLILGDTGSEITSCYCSTVRVYNRVLSAAEVLQNYNATKGKFGL